MVSHYVCFLIRVVDYFGYFLFFYSSTFLQTHYLPSSNARFPFDEPRTQELAFDCDTHRDVRDVWQFVLLKDVPHRAVTPRYATGESLLTDAEVFSSVCMYIYIYCTYILYSVFPGDVSINLIAAYLM